MTPILFIYFVITNCCIWSTDAESDRFFKNEVLFSPLNGKHLIITGQDAILDLRYTRNSSGHVLKYDGIAGEMLRWLSPHFNFTYSPLQVNTTPIDDSGNKPGLISLMKRGYCDVVTTVAITTSRIALVDFCHPTNYFPVSFVILTPNSTFDTLAVTKPFQNNVWTSILISTSATLLSLYIFSWYLERKKIGIGALQEETLKMTYYVIGILCHQAAYFSNKNNAIRLVAGAWCLTALVLVHCYDSLLTSYITVPNPQPLIKSVFDLRTRGDIRVVTDKNFNIDAILSSAESGIYKDLGDRLRAFRDSRCSSMNECVKWIKEGRTVYISGRQFNAVKQDVDMTGKCTLQVGKESFMSLNLAWTLEKKSSYTDFINKGIMRMAEAGLLDKWFKENIPDLRRCQDDGINSKKRGMAESHVAPLNLEPLSSSFYIILIGSFVSALVLIAECGIRKHNNIRKA